MTEQWLPPDPADRVQPAAVTPTRRRKWKVKTLLAVLGGLLVIGIIGSIVDPVKPAVAPTPAALAPATTVDTVAVQSAAAASRLEESQFQADESRSSAESASTAAGLDTPTTADAVNIYPTKSYSGKGDDVVDIGSFTKTGILSFKCLRCAANVVLNTNGPEGLLVNTIGGYSGTHFINLRDNSLTTRLTINADGPWQVEISDTTHVSLGSSGTGDKAIFLPGPGSKAKITNTGDANFVVQSYGATSDLLVNEIGGYSGTVPIELPAFVQVESNGSWSIAVS